MLRRFSVGLLCGGGCFWTAPVLGHWFGVDCWGASGPAGWFGSAVFFILLPAVATGLGALLLIRRQDRAGAKGAAAVGVLAGVWITGPAWMMAGLAVAADGGQWSAAGSLGERLVDVLRFTLVFPIATFSMAAYDGSLAALLVISGMLVMVAAVYLSRELTIRGNGNHSGQRPPSGGPAGG